MPQRLRPWKVDKLLWNIPVIQIKCQNISRPLWHLCLTKSQFLTFPPQTEDKPKPLSPLPSCPCLKRQNVILRDLQMSFVDGVQGPGTIKNQECHWQVGTLQQLKSTALLETSLCRVVLYFELWAITSERNPDVKPECWQITKIRIMNGQGFWSRKDQMQISLWRTTKLR